MEAKMILGGYGNNGLPQSAMGHSLLKLEWDFNKQELEGHQYAENNKKEYAQAFVKTMDAADAIGMVEHTNDWDPILNITFKDGTKYETESHYYQGEVLGGVLKIEAPSPDDYTIWEQLIPKDKYYKPSFSDSRSWYEFPIKDIALITVDSQ
jgi:hypothetical protein